MISLRNVEKVYPLKGGVFYALRNINLDIREGEFVSIMGPSGSGKSTLLHILGLHDSAWTGEYHLLGEPVHKLDKKKRFELQKKHIGFVFQSYHLLDDLTVYENLEIPLSYRDTPKKERESVVCDILADEPTGNLHSDQGREIMKLFKKLNSEGTTIIQVTHSEENASYGSRVIRLADGMMVSG